MTAISHDATHESDDAFRIAIVPATELLLLQRDAAHGDADAGRITQAAISIGQEVAAASQDQPARCACCSQDVLRSDPYLIGCVLPDVGEPTFGIGFLICDRCGFTPERLDATVAQMVRRSCPDDDAEDRTPRGGGRA